MFESHRKDVIFNIKNDIKNLIYSIDDYRICFRYNNEANSYFDSIQTKCYFILDMIENTFNKNINRDIPDIIFIEIKNKANSISEMINKIFEFEKDKNFLDLYA